ncbi:MAG TPA: glycosyltransferase family 39 protein [Chthoniobacterales bacterium]|nr:glycosyltransferase family 39 protein [Chthoniobacterales bacterium]
MRHFVKTRYVSARAKWLLVLIAIVAFLVRLIAIDQPFIDPWSWRQSDVAAIARNYLESGFHFGRPQIDWAGNEPGFVGTEFPILPFVAALCYKSVGVQEWVGRIQGVLFFVVALPFLFGLVRRIFGEAVAIWAAFFYAFAPLSIEASRSFIPDVPSLSLAIIGMYFFLRWIEEEKFRWLVWSAILVSLALLIKLPIAIVGAPLFYLAWQRDRKIFARWELWLFAAVTLVPSAIWYWHAHRIAEQFYPYHFFGAGGFAIMSFAWYWKILRLTVFSGFTLVLFVLAILGALTGSRGKFSRFFHWWLAAAVVFIFFVGYGNRHPWYQLPLVPIAAVFAGCACAWIARSGLARPLLGLGAVLLIGSFAVSSWFCVQPRYRPAAASLRDLGLELNEATTSSALIIAATDGDPTIFYYAHRKGWHFLGDGVYDGNPLDSAQIIANLEKLRSRGATHLVFYAGTQWWLDYYKEFAEHLAANATLVEQTPEFTIYKLNAASP